MRRFDVNRFSRNLIVEIDQELLFSFSFLHLPGLVCLHLFVSLNATIKDPRAQLPQLPVAAAAAAAAK
jgi:hypothetical protein